MSSVLRNDAKYLNNARQAISLHGWNKNRVFLESLSPILG